MKCFLFCRAALAFSVMVSYGHQAPSADFPKADATALPIQAKIHTGVSSDWLAIGFGSVWVSVPKSDEIVRINPANNTIQARIKAPGEPCYGIGIGTTYVWVLTCKSQMLSRIRPQDNVIDRMNSVRIAPHGEGSIAVEDDTVWFIGNENGRSSQLYKIRDLKTEITEVGADSAVVNTGFVSIWVTSSGESQIYRVDPNTLKVIARIKVPAKPRFTTVGEDSVWVLSQSDGSVSRIDPAHNKVVATIQPGARGEGGDIAYGGGYVWVSAAGTPLTRIDPKSNKVLEQYGNYKGADAVRFGFGSVWISDHGTGDVWRIDPNRLALH